MLLIFQLVLRVDYNIIQVGCIEVIKVVKEYIVYILLVRSQSVSQSKRKYLIFIRSIISLKCSKILRPRVYPNLVEGLADIKLYKDLSSTYLGQSLIKQGQQIAVLTGYIIQLIVVNIETESSIQLFSKENRRVKRGLTRLNKALIQVINKVLLYSL